MKTPQIICATRCPPSSQVVCQAEAFLTQLLSEDAVLVRKVVDDVLPMAIYPTGCGDDQQLPGT
jgi:hypothetical protein